MVDRFIRETEEVINRLNEKREMLKAELEGLDEQEAEARGVLQFLKKGGVNPVAPKETPTPARKKRAVEVSRDDFLAAVDAVAEENDEFTAKQVGVVLDQKSNVAVNRLMRMAKDKDYVRVTRKAEFVVGKGKTPTYFRKLRSPV